ncbi:MAG: MoaD/ThiS family protein [Bacillota bacterium]
MEIEVRLFAHLRQLAPDGPIKVVLDDGSTVQRLIDHLGINNEKNLIIMVNGRRQEEDTELFNADRVGIFPPVGGG